MRIVGIDMSLTGTGLAEITLDSGALDDIVGIKTHVVTSKSTKDAQLRDHFNRQTEITTGVLDFVLGPGEILRRDEQFPDLVVIESLFNSATNAGMLIDRAGLWWRIVGSLLCWDITVVQANQSQGKKFLTGSGSADKGAMAMYASKLYPHWDPATLKNANDEADAIALASIGVGLMTSDEDWPYPITDYRQKIIDDIDKKQLRGAKAA